MKLLRVEKISFCHLHLRITTCNVLLPQAGFHLSKDCTTATQRTTLQSTYQTMSETEAAAAAAASAATDAPKKKGGAGGRKTEKATKEPERRSARPKKAPTADTMTAPVVKAAA